MDKKTEEFLQTLRADGFDVSSLETQINSSPVLEAKAKDKIGGSVLRQDAFTRQMQDANRVKIEYEDKIKNLAAGNDTINSLALNDPARKALEEVIKAQTDLLVSEGYDRTELEALSFKALNLATEKKDDKVIPPKEEDKKMDRTQDDTKYITADVLERQSEMGVYASVHTNALVNAALAEAGEIGVKIPRDKILSITSELKRRVDAGEQVANIIDNHFGLDTGREVYQKATRDKELADAKQSGYAEGLKESGTPIRRVTKLGESPITASQNIRRTPIKEFKAEEDKNTPVNKYGDAEVFRNRRDSNSRIERQMLHMDKVLEGTNVAVE